MQLMFIGDRLWKFAKEDLVPEPGGPDHGPHEEPDGPEGVAAGAGRVPVHLPLQVPPDHVGAAVVEEVGRQGAVQDGGGGPGAVRAAAVRPTLQWGFKTSFKIYDLL